MSNLQVELHSDNFDYCRLCLLQPETARSTLFYKIFERYGKLLDLTRLIRNFLGVEVKESDNFPKIICGDCFTYLMNAHERETKTINNQIIFKYLYKKKFGDGHTNTNSTFIAKNVSTNPMNYSLSTSVLSLPSQSTSVLPSSLPSTSALPFCSPSTSALPFCSPSTSALPLCSPSTSALPFCSPSTSALPLCSPSTSALPLCSPSTSALPFCSPSTSALPFCSPSTSALPLSSPSTSHYSRVHSLEKNSSPSTSHYSRVNSLKKEVISKSVTQANVLPSSSNSQCTSGQTSSNYQSLKPVYQSSDSDDTTSIDNNNYANIYCLLCQKYIKYDHDCCEYNKNISTCLVPNCNILSRTFNEILPHYKYHVALYFGGTLCRVCRRSYERNVNKICELNECSSNTIYIDNVFKCFDCDIVFQTMIELACHKLQIHDCVFKDSTGKYICLHCEMSSNKMTEIVAHLNSCSENALNFKRGINKKHKQKPMANSLRGKRNYEGVLIPKNKKNKNIENTKHHMLFTCTKPSCKQIFVTFGNFKNHFREHFGIGNQLLMCWQCLTTFESVRYLRLHQQTKCRNSDTFTCHECSKKHKDLEALSIHNYIFHDGVLIYSKRAKKMFINCRYCKQNMNVHTLKKHLIKCSFMLDKIE